jgi:conserved protein with predicted RNA binding PUA domain
MCFRKLGKSNQNLSEKKIRGQKSKSATSKKKISNAKNESQEKKATFDKSKTMMTIDYIFGPGVSKKIDFSKVSFVHSRKTGRIKQLEDKQTGRVLFTFRPNGTIAPTLAGASMMVSGKFDPKSKWIVTVLDGVSEVVASGKTVFSKHVVRINETARPGDDVVIVNEKRELLAVGRLVSSGSTVKQFKRGQAVKVREGSS